MAYTYTTLSAAISNWADRTYSQSQIDEFIMLAEAAFNRRLGGYQRELAASIDLAEGVGTLPAGFIRFLDVAFPGVPSVAATFRISGTTVTTFPTTYPSVDVTYASRLVGLSDANPTNWLLDLAPDAYLFMCKAMQRAFEEDWQVSAGYAAQANAIIDDLNLQNITAKHGSAGLVIHGPTP